jgi:hypothetical protein
MGVQAGANQVGKMLARRQPRNFANLAFELKLPPAMANISNVRRVLTRAA